MTRTDEEWKKLLTVDQYAVLRDKATETPFTGALLYNEDEGTYLCAACGAELFASEHKFEAHCGWPSFNNVIDSEAVTLKEDRRHGMQRVEALCKSCGGHLGHVFNDAPDQPTGVRFCINSVSLGFKPDKQKGR
jgi:peptide-methionine (R)-S-oxide reductase